MLLKVKARKAPKKATKAKKVTKAKSSPKAKKSVKATKKPVKQQKRNISLLGVKDVAERGIFFYNSGENTPLDVAPYGFDYETLGATKVGIEAPQVSVLPNGIKIVTQNAGVPITNISLSVDMGSRAESVEDQGLTDFMAQAILRTTENRISAGLHKDMSKLGADIQAYAAREQFVISATTPTRINAVVGAIADVINYPVYDFNDLRCDLPFYELDQVHQQAHAPLVIEQALHAAAWGNKGLGKNPSLVHVGDVTTPRMMAFHKKLFKNPQNITISAIGVDSHDDFAALCEELFMPMSAPSDAVVAETDAGAAKDAESDNQWVGASIRVHAIDAAAPATVVLGFKSAGLNTPKKAVTTHVLQRILGGQDAVAGLFKMSESHNWIKSTQAGYVAYKNTGLFSIQAEVEAAAAGAYTDLITKFVRALPTTITEQQVTKAKNGLATKMLQDLSSGLNRSQEHAQHVNIYGDVQTDAILNLINNVTVADVQQVANELSYLRPALVTLGDATALPAVVDTFASEADRQKFMATQKQ